MGTAIDTLLSCSPNVCGGRIRIDGTRVTVHQIVTCYQQGLTPEEIAFIPKSADNYVKHVEEYLEELGNFQK